MRVSRRADTNAAPQQEELQQTLIQLAKNLIFVSSKIAEGAGLSSAQWALLHQITHSSPEGVAPSTLAEANRTSRANVTKLTRRLEALGLVTVRTHAQDARQRRWVPTARGRRALERLNLNKTRRLTATLEHMSKADQAALLRLCRVLLVRLAAAAE
jgi:DNA-binding MarR family transcriptional regulator